MPDLTFSQPIPVRIKDEKFDLLKPALKRMGLMDMAFYATRITEDGKVIPDPACLSPNSDAAYGTPVNGRLCEFEPEVVALLRQLRHTLAS